MRIAYLGAGTWGFCLASLLARKGHTVESWTLHEALASELNATKEHPILSGRPFEGDLTFSTDLKKVVQGKDLIVESVTAGGVRPVFEKVLELGGIDCPIVLTSKGIELDSGKILPDVLIELFGEEIRSKICCLSGPSHAEEVSRGLPTSVVSASSSAETMSIVADAFTTTNFRVYPNSDIVGVAMGGALKNIIAIASGVSDGLNFGCGAKASLVTRGLHEIQKLAVSKGCRRETFYGLAGLGDLSLTSFSPYSRNYRFGKLLAEGNTPEEAKEKIGMVVEGALTCKAAIQISRQDGIPMPIAEAVYAMIYEDLKPLEAVLQLMQRAVKEEHL